MSRPVKRSFTIGGHRTSISLEAPFWDALKAVALRERIPLSNLIRRIDAERGDSGLSSAVRIWLLGYYRDDGSNRRSSPLSPPAGRGSA
jgi:predicted DNA-binding ribbon-helix-helix protein